MAALFYLSRAIFIENGAGFTLFFFFVKMNLLRTMVTRANEAKKKNKFIYARCRSSF